MRFSRQKASSGFALLIFMVALMGLGGIAVAGFSQKALKEVEKSRYEHNREVLEEAKQALLMYAYRYPSIAGRGPGRLPCPDTDNNGRAEALSPCLNNNEIVGRLPWDNSDLNFYDARDASGERLWYAVSATFDYGPATTINSDSTGTISIFDQTGNLLYDGATNGVAAVIIAPGSAINNQDRSIANGDDPNDTTPDTDPGIVTVANYLDSFNAFDNSDFLNGGVADGDGFILGPVSNNNNLVINDQMVVITTEEVVAMAEKATLEAYRNSINDYQNNIWAGITADYRYPWLHPYDSSDDLPDDLMTIPLPLPVSDPIIGRVPSIFGNYFNGSASGSIKSEIEINVLYDSATWNETLAIVDVNFNAVGDLETTSTESFTRIYYFWDGHAVTPDAASPRDGVWELCTGTAGTGGGGTGSVEDDCNRKTDGTFKSPADTFPHESDVWLEVKRVTLEFNTATGNIPAFLNLNLKGLPLIYEAPTGLKHALISADYNIHPSFDFDSEIDDDFKSSFNSPDPGPAFGVDPADRIRVGIRYYPELPSWVVDNLWYDNIMLAYSAALQADGVDNVCTPPVLPFDAATDLTSDYCLILENSGGITNDKAAILFSAGAANPGLFDDGLPVAGSGFADDLVDIFEGENATPAFSFNDIGSWTDYYNPAAPPVDYERLELNLKFDRRANNDNSNDIVLVLQ